MAQAPARDVIEAACVLAVVLAAAGCGGGPEPIAWGRDECAACRMRIADPRFAAQLVTARGKTASFDAVECLLGALERTPADEVGSVWVADFAHPGSMTDARAARYLRTESVRSPMGFNVLAFTDDTGLAAARTEHPGEVLSWDELPAARRRLGVPGRPPAPGGRPGR